jgi:hypothetical protein
LLNQSKSIKIRRGSSFRTKTELFQPKTIAITDVKDTETEPSGIITRFYQKKLNTVLLIWTNGKRTRKSKSTVKNGLRVGDKLSIRYNEPIQNNVIAGSNKHLLLRILK